MATRFFNNGDWSVPVFPVGVIGRLTTDLCNAVNERQDAFSKFLRNEDQTLPTNDPNRVVRGVKLERFNEELGNFEDITGQFTEWTLPDGTTKSKPEESDFTGISVGDEYWAQIVVEIQDAIEALFVNQGTYNITYLREWFEPTNQIFTRVGDFQQVEYTWYFEITPSDLDTDTPGDYAPIDTKAQLLGSGSLGETDWIPTDNILLGAVWLQMLEAIIKSFYTISTHRTNRRTLLDAFNGVTIGESDQWYTLAYNVFFNGVVSGDSVTLNSVRFVAAAENDFANREFGITAQPEADPPLTGDEVATLNFADLFNDPVFGAEGTTTTVGSAFVVNVDSNDHDNFTLLPAHHSLSMQYFVTTQRQYLIDENWSGSGTLHAIQRGGSSRSQALDVAWTNAVGGGRQEKLTGLDELGSAQEFSDLPMVWSDVKQRGGGVSPISGQAVLFDDLIFQAMGLDHAVGILLHSNIAIYTNFVISNSFDFLEEDLPYTINCLGDLTQGKIPARLPGVPSDEDPNVNELVSTAVFTTTKFPVGTLERPWANYPIVTLDVWPGINPWTLNPGFGTQEEARFFVEFRDVRVRLGSSIIARLDQFPNYCFSVYQIDHISGLQWY